MQKYKLGFRVNPISLSYPFPFPYPFVLPLALVPRNRVVSARGVNILSRIVAMNFASHTTRGHSPTTWTFTQLQITHRLHFPSFTAPTQLFTIITLAPVHHHPITHTLHKPWTFSHTLPSIVSPAAYKAFPKYS